MGLLQWWQRTRCGYGSEPEGTALSLKGEGIKKLGPSVEGPQRWKNPSLAVPQDGEESQIVREHEGIVRLGGDRAETKEGKRLYRSSVGQRFTVKRGEIAPKG